MDDILELSKKMYLETKSHRDYLHKHPELSFKETNTSRYIISCLNKLGISYQVVNGTSVVGWISYNDSEFNNTIALRADIDALPLEESVDNENYSTNGLMHACGHDIHTATLLSVAKIIVEKMVDYSATFVFIFQQGEEVLPGGASEILSSGVLDKFNIKLLIGQHVEYSMNTGEFGVCEGMYMASGDEMHIKINGIGGHAANVHLINNPIIAGSELCLAIKSIEIDAPDDIPTILSIGKFVGLGATNIVPDGVCIEGTFRTMNESWRLSVKDRIKCICATISRKYNVDVLLNIIDGYSMLYNDVNIAKRAKISLSKIGVVHDLGVKMTTEDFSAYSSKYPTVFYRCGIKNPNWSTLYAPHTSVFRADEESLIFSVAGMVSLVFDCLSSGDNSANSSVF